MAKELTRTGVVGLELTREEVIDIKGKVDALLRKAQCREINQDVITRLSSISKELDTIDFAITGNLDMLPFV